MKSFQRKGAYLLRASNKLSASETLEHASDFILLPINIHQETKYQMQGSSLLQQIV